MALMDKFIVVDDPNDKFAIVDDQQDKFAEHQQPHYKFAVTEESERAFAETHSPQYKYSVGEGSPQGRFVEAQIPHHKFTVENGSPVKDGAKVEDGAQPESAPRKRRWPLWKILAVAGIALVIILALSIGLGVGLTQNKGEDNSSQPTDGQGQQDGGQSGGDSGNSGSDSGGTSEGDEGSSSGGGSNGNNSTTNEPSEPSSWVPKIGDTFQMVIANSLRLNNDSDASPDVNIFDIDLFDNDSETISSLKSAGRRVLCYFSAGSWEEWREDKDYFDDDDLGSQLSDDYPGERYINISSPGIRNVMKGRISRAKQSGCDGIDAGYIDSYHSKNGLNLTSADAISYVKFLSTEARSHGLAVGLKNGGEIVRDLLDWVDFSINEQCLKYNECSDYVPFIKANKAVFNIAYPSGAPGRVPKQEREELCAKKGAAPDTDKFVTILKTEDLDGWVMYCDGKTHTTEVNDSSD
ncbi:hypothetical protein HJFPF1_03414 [Paramyrothecium foliicola]|nr:hypothetical protein HJFPF1_03414 [Paramyrothecium foliicola]